METSRLQQFKMNRIEDEGLDEIHYPQFNSIVSTDDWLIIFARVLESPIRGLLVRFFFANNEWKLLNYERLPQIFNYVTLSLLDDRYLVVHGTTNDTGNVYKTFIGNVNRHLIKFKHIGSLRIMNHDTGICRHQIVGDDVNHMYLVHGYRKHYQHLMVYKLNIKKKIWVQMYKHLEPDQNDLIKYDTCSENRTLFYDKKLHVFPIMEYEDRIYDDFSRVFVFELRTAAWHTVSTSPLGQTPAIGPRMRDTGDYALAPYDPVPAAVTTAGQRRCALITGGMRSSPWHDSWTLDLSAYRWYQVPLEGQPLDWPRADGPPPPQQEGPQADWLLQRVLPCDSSVCTAVVTSQGRLYAIRNGRVFGAWIRQPEAEDQQWDALLHRYRSRIFAPGGDLSDRALYHHYGLTRELAIKIRHAHTGRYENPRRATTRRQNIRRIIRPSEL